MISEEDFHPEIEQGIGKKVTASHTGRTAALLDRGAPYYAAVPNGNIINPLLQMGKYAGDSAVSMRKLCAEAANSTGIYIDLGGVVLLCQNAQALPVKLQDRKLILHLMELFCKKNTNNETDIEKIDRNRHFTYQVRWFAELLGWKYSDTNRRNVVKELKASIARLQQYILVVKEGTLRKSKLDKKGYVVERYIPLLGGVTMNGAADLSETSAETSEKQRFSVKIAQGSIEISLSMELAKLLSVSPIMYYPPELKTTKNPLSFSIGYALITHFNINAQCHHFTNGRVRKVSSLLEKCSDLPSYEKIRRTNRTYYESIMKPLCLALAELESFEINLCRKTSSGDYEALELDIKNGKCDFFKGYTFENFLELYVIFEPKNYPELR